MVRNGCQKIQTLVIEELTVEKRELLVFLKILMVTVREFMIYLIKSK